MTWEKSRRARGSKRKGKVGEREFAHFLRDFGIYAKRGVQHQGGSNSPDVVHDLKGIHFEVKRSESLTLYTALAQATLDSLGTGDTPVVAHRRNRKPWVVLLYADDFVRLVQKGETHEDG